MLKLPGLFFVALSGFTMVSGAVAAQKEVELLTDSEFLQPTSTFEFRFVTPVVGRDDVGTVATDPPIRIEPAIAGAFTWLSQRSGVFVPTAPPPLGSGLVVTIRSDFRDLNGKPIGQAFRTVLKTPPYGITSVVAPQEDEITPKPEIRLAFNLDTALDPTRFRFVSAGGQETAAKVRYATEDDYFDVPVENLDWNRRWTAPTPPQSGEPNEEETQNPPSAEASDVAKAMTDKTEGKPLRDRMIVSPEEPLAADQDWHLEIAAGLKSVSGSQKIDEPKTVPIGIVPAFTIKNLMGSNYIHSGRAIRVEFTRSLAGDILTSTASKFFQVEPAVEHLRYEVDGSELDVFGDFALGQSYRFIIGPDVVDEFGAPYSGDQSKAVQFSPVKPRVYLPVVVGDQFRGGAREFEALSINVRRLHVRALLVDPASGPVARTAFASYEHNDKGTEDEPNQRIAEGKLSGKSIFDRTIELPDAAIDKRLRTQIDWDQIVGASRGGMLLLTIEADPIPEAGKQKVGAQALVQLTDIGALWARQSNTLRFSIFSLTSGLPSPSAGIRLLDADFKEIAKVSSDETGMATIPFTPEIQWALITERNDAYTLRLGETASTLNQYWLGNIGNISYLHWDVNHPEERSGMVNARCFVFTDRPLYRPGETVHVKGLARELKQSGLAPAEGLRGRVIVTDAQEQRAYSAEIATDRDGEFEADIPLNESSVGRNRLRVAFPDEASAEFRGDAEFEVANYEPNAFEVNLALPEQLSPSMEVRAEVTAKYLFGAALTQAKVRWTLQAAPTSFSPEDFAEYTFSLPEEQTKTTTVTGSAAYDGVNPVIIQPAMPATSERPIRGVLTVEMTDLNQQTVTVARVFQKAPAAFYLGIAGPESSVVHSGVPLPIQCVAVTPDGKPLDEPVNVRLELFRKHSQTVRVKTAGKGVSFHTNSFEEKVGEWSGQTLQPERQLGKWVTPDSKTAEVTLPVAGEYVLRARAQDKDGGQVSTEYSLYDSGNETVTWDYRNASQIDLIPDKAEYHPGDVAHVLVKSPFTGQAIVDIARGPDILRSERVKLEGNTPTLDIPVTANDLPNVYVSAILIRGATDSTRKIKTPEFRYGLAKLTVSDPATELGIQITPSKRTFEPGEPIEVKLLVRDGLDRPVADGHLVFFAVDDGVLALTDYSRPDPHSTFFHEVPLNVQMGMTLDSLLADDLQDLQFTNKGYLIGGGGVEGPGIKLRTNFPGTLCWLPSVHTDATGQATLKFAAPDAITRYRLIAVAWAGGSQFGSAESAVTIQKPLLIIPSMAQFVRSGDKLVARAVIRNDAGHSENVRVQLHVDGGFSSQEPTELALTVENGAAQTVDFPLVAGSPGSSHWQWVAQTPDHSDGVAADTVVGPAGTPLREIYLSDLPQKQQDLFTGINPQLLEGGGVVNVTLSNTRLSSLQEAVASLRAYPYDCSEQLTSSLVPWLVSEQLKSSIPSLLTNETSRRENVSSTLSELFKRQTGSGGLALWPGGDDPFLFATAYAAWVMAGLQQQGIDLPEKKWQSLLSYLSESLRGLPQIRDDGRLQEMALAAWALAAAGKPEAAYNEALFQVRSLLSHETRALVALAFLSSGKATRDVVDTLLNPKASAPDAVWLYGGGAREDALRLLAWTRYRPRSGEIAPLVKELLAERHNGRWDTTQENAWSLLALANYYQSSETAGQSVDGSVVSGSRSLPFALDRRTPSWSTGFVLDPTNPMKDLLVQRNGSGALFGEAQFEVYPVVVEQPRQDRGYGVTRTYQKVADDGKLQPAENLKVGDRILVTINIKASRAGRLVAIDDPVPSVFEPINPNFKAQSDSATASLGRDRSHSTVDESYADYRVIRGDRVELFRNQFPAGDYNFTYLSRVRFAGEAIAPGTKVLEMYRPDRFGLGETMRVKSEK
jgi:alpha-2-macroglobulin